MCACLVVQAELTVLFPTNYSFLKAKTTYLNIRAQCKHCRKKIIKLYYQTGANPSLNDFEEANITNSQNRDKSQQGAATVFSAVMSVITQFVDNS